MLYLLLNAYRLPLAIGPSSDLKARQSLASKINTSSKMNDAKGEEELQECFKVQFVGGITVGSYIAPISVSNVPPRQIYQMLRSELKV